MATLSLLLRPPFPVLLWDAEFGEAVGVEFAGVGEAMVGEAVGKRFAVVMLAVEGEVEVDAVEERLVLDEDDGKVVVRDFVEICKLE